MRFAIVVLLAGCATQRFALPMTASELAQAGSGGALVAYLTQQGASASVCDLNSSGPHAGPLDKDTAEAIAKAVRDGKIAPEPGRACLDALLTSAPREAANQLLGQILAADVDLITNDSFEKDKALQARAAALQPLYLQHEAGFTNTANARKAIGKKKLGPEAQKLAAELTTALDLEAGILNGQKIDNVALDALVAKGDEATLLRCVRLLPSQALRTEARRRVIQIHVRASQFPEVRENEARIAQEMMGGTNPISLRRHPVVSATLKGPPLPAVLVEQDIVNKTARLLSQAAVLPELPLRGALQVTVEGISQPITLCAPARELDPSPCILPSDIQFDPAFVRLDAAGTLHFLENISADEATKLAQQQEQLEVPLSLAGKPVTAARWPLQFTTPKDLILNGPTPGGRGPDLKITAGSGGAGRLLYALDNGMQAVVERHDAALFHIVSSGGAGAEGARGSSGWGGTDGSSGSNASCPSTSGGDGGDGSDGGNGGDGGSGGDGGPGGTIEVHATEMAFLRSVILSEGGAAGRGGDGGSAGAGGRGGAGGNGATCTDSNGQSTTLSGGNSGRDGHDGFAGSPGSAGRPGPPGRVIFTAR